MKYSLFATLALPLLSAPALAQDWIREEPLNVSAEMILPRQGGGTVDLAVDQVTGASLLRSINHDGTVQSRHGFDAVLGGSISVNRLASMPDGRVALLGNSVNEDQTEVNPWVGVVDPDTASGGWHREISTGPAAVDQGLTIRDALVLDGGLYLFGRTLGTRELLILRCDLDGHLEWSKRAELSGYEVFSPTAAPSASGGFVLLFLDEHSDTHILSFDTEATLEWHAYYDTFAGRGLCQTANGETWVVGYEASGASVVLALSTTGQKLWSQEYLGYPALSETIRPTADGGAVLCGGRKPDAFFQPTLLGLDATGAPLWHRMYDLTSADPDLSIIGTGLVDAGAAGWILEVQEDLKGLHLAVQADGSASLPCVDVLDLATFAAPTSTGPDEPPDVLVESIDLISSPLLVQPLPEADPMTLVCGSPCSVTFTTTGPDLPGSGFIAPELTGVDGACVGAPRPRLEIKKGLGGTVGALGYSIGTSSLNLLGGTILLDFQTLITQPIVLDGATGVAGAGAWSQEIEASLVEMMGVTLAAQTILLDPGAVQGWSFSRGLLFWIF